LDSEHSHRILKQIECCSDEKNIYWITNYYEGDDLFEHLVKYGRIEDGEAQMIIGEVVRSIQYIHSKGIAHRDVSLENIIYHPQSRTITLVDFGLCTHVRRNESTGRNIRQATIDFGKEHYMAPEHFSMEEVDPMLCDVWAVGVCLLYLLLGFPPIGTANVRDDRYTYIINGRLAELVGHWGVSISPSAINLLENILQPNPMDRYSLTQILLHPWFETPQTSVESLVPVLSSISAPSFIYVSITEAGTTMEDQPSNQSSVVTVSNATLGSVFSIVNPFLVGLSSSEKNDSDHTDRCRLINSRSANEL